jgi:uncharacterized membrane protein
MTENNLNNPEPITPKPEVKKKKRWRPIALGLIILFSGFVLGVGCSAVFFKRMVHMIQKPGEASQRITKKLRWKLWLSDEQTNQVRAVLTEREKAVFAIFHDVGPRLITELNRTKEEVAAVLNPDQEQKWRKHFDKKMKRWIPMMEPQRDKSSTSP